MSSLKRMSDSVNREVLDAITDISKKMDEFSASVARLKDLEEKPERLRDEIALAEAEKEKRIALFDKRMRDHKVHTIQEVLSKHGKTVIDADEYEELQKLQVRESAEERKRKEQEFEDEVEEKVAVELKLIELEYQKRFAEATAREASFAAEKNMLYLTIDSLKAEIESQKKLTSELALQAHKAN